MDVKFSASLCLSDIDPVDSLIAGAEETVRFHKCLEKSWTVSVASLPVLWDAFGHHCQELRSKVL